MNRRCLSRKKLPRPLSVLWRRKDRSLRRLCDDLRRRKKRPFPPQKVHGTWDPQRRKKPPRLTLNPQNDPPTKKNKSFGETRFSTVKNCFKTRTVKKDYGKTLLQGGLGLTPQSICTPVTHHLPHSHPTPSPPYARDRGDRSTSMLSFQSKIKFCFHNSTIPFTRI